MRFEFASAGRILFGPGCIAESGAAAREFGQRGLVVTGRTSERVQRLMTTLAAEKVDAVTFSVSGEPTTAMVAEGVALAASAGCEVVIGIGGGSALDAAKAIAALLANGGEPLDYLEVVGRGRKLTKPSLPCIAIPTTAGTGAEVTRNAVLGSPEHGVKASLRSPTMLPRLALIDPELTYDLPQSVTASTGLDALTQLIEPFVSIRANPLADGFCREGMSRAARSLRQAYEHGADPRAREEMALASLLGGLALANAGLGTVHGFASVIGGMYHAPHGTVCAAFLPHVMAANLAALRKKQPEAPVIQRYAEVARLVTGDAAATAEDGVTWVQTLCRELRVPPLAAYGVTPDACDVIVSRTAAASSTKANPIVLSAEELRQILLAVC